jgi:hypothetical protein
MPWLLRVPVNPNIKRLSLIFCDFESEKVGEQSRKPVVNVVCRNSFRRLTHNRSCVSIVERQKRRVSGAL